jgi:hypothetical protein
MKRTTLQILEMLLLLSAVIAYAQNQHDLALLMAVFAVYVRIDRHDDSVIQLPQIVAIPKPDNAEE